MKAARKTNANAKNTENLLCVKDNPNESGKGTTFVQDVSAMMEDIRGSMGALVLPQKAFSVSCILY